jgi:chromosome segregation ATPase
MKRGANILDKARGEEKEVPAPKETSTATETQEVDPKMVKNPDDWSKESALKEVVKLREENKIVRTKFTEQMEKLEKEMQEKIAKIEASALSAKEAQKKLEALEAEQADKKRSIEDKLANREARLAETEAVYKAKLDEKEKEVLAYKSKALQYEAEQEARKQVYRDRTKEELDKVPVEYREFAEKMVKGYDDPHEGWIAISEANRKNVFGEKKIVVNHSVPGAADGARVNKAKAEADEKEKRSKMDSKSLIKAGLAKAMKGENTAYRGR